LRSRILTPGMEALSHKVLTRPNPVSLIEAVSSVSFALGGDTLLEVRQFSWMESAVKAEDDALLDDLKDALLNKTPNKHVLFLGTKADKKLKWVKWLLKQEGVDVQQYDELPFYK